MKESQKVQLTRANTFALQCKLFQYQTLLFWYDFIWNFCRNLFIYIHVEKKRQILCHEFLLKNKPCFSINLKTDLIPVVCGWGHPHSLLKDSQNFKTR